MFGDVHGLFQIPILLHDFYEISTLISYILSPFFRSAAVAMTWKKSGSAFFPFFETSPEGQWIPHSSVLLSESVIFFHEPTIFVC